MTAALLIAIACLFFSLISILQIHQVKLAQSRGNLYGYFHAIVYQSSDEIEDEQYSSQLPSEIAAIRVLPVQLKDDTTVYAGTYNKTAVQMMYRGDRHFTALDSEDAVCLLSKSLARSLNKDVADTIDINGKPFCIQDLVPDVGFFWIRGEREEANKMEVPNLWVSEDRFKEQFNSEVENSYRLLLLNRQQTSEFEVMELKGQLYENMPMLRDENIFVFRFPKDFFVTQLVALFALVTILLGGYRHYAKKRYSIYLELGLPENRLCLVIRLECLWLVLITLSVSVIIAGLICMLYVHLAYPDPSFFSIPMYLQTIKYYLLAFMLAWGTCFLSQARFGQRYQGKSLRFKKHCIPIRGTWVLLCSLPLLWLLVYMILSFYTSVSYVNHMSRSIEHFGQINQKFDYDLHYVPEVIPPGYYRDGSRLKQAKGSDAPGHGFFYDNYGQKLDELARKVDALEGVALVERFYENHYGQLVVPETIIQSAFIEKIYPGSLFPIESGPFTEQYIREATTALIDCDLYMLPDHYLHELADRINIDEARREALFQGEAGLLISPSIKITKVERDETGEGIYWKRSTEGEDLIKDTALPDYQTVTVYFAQADQTLSGNIPQEDLLTKGATLERLNIPIAGSSYENLAWFSNFYFSPRPYRILVSENFFSKTTLKFETTRVRIVLDEKADYEAISKIIASYVRDIPNLQLTNQYYNMEVLREFRFMERIVFVMYGVLFAILLFAFAFSIGHVFYLENEKNFSLYRDLGISVRELLLNCIRRYIPLLFLACAIQLLVNRFLLWELIWGWSEILTVNRILLQVPVFVLYILLYLVILSFRIRYLMRQQDYIL